MAEELVKPKGREPQPASTSLFEWAFAPERDAELVGDALPPSQPTPWAAARERRPCGPLPLYVFLVADYCVGG